eukprot:5101491-Alexandrium_andersonii.AAC.1
MPTHSDPVPPVHHPHHPKPQPVSILAPARISFSLLVLLAAAWPPLPVAASSSCAGGWGRPGERACLS